MTVHYLESHGASLIDNGYRILPIEPGTKSPNIKGWTQIEASSATLAGWLSEGKAAWGVGVLGEHTPAVDIDVSDVAVLDLVLAWCEKNIGATPKRIGRAPRVALVCRAATPFAKFKSRKFVAPDGGTHQVEIIGKGGQFVAYHIHPDTKQPYAWPGESLLDMPVDFLPELSEGTARALVAYFESIVPTDWTPVQSAAGGVGEHPSNPARTAALTAIESALSHTPNEDLDYDDWIRVGYALKGAVGSHDGDGCAMFHEWSSKSAKYDPEHAQKAWDAIGEVKSIGAGTLFHLAEQAGWSRPIATAGDEFGPVDMSPSPFPWANMTRWDGAPVPVREWVIPDYVPIRQVGVFSGEGGTGKSILELQKNVAHVIGGDWLGLKPLQGGAFYLGCEDEEDEIHRRLADIAEHHGTTFSELHAKGLRVLPLLGMDATLCAVNHNSGRVETTRLYKRLYEEAGDLKPRNISVDTLSRAFSGNEIDRVQVYAFAMHMQALAKVANASVTVLSHPSLSGMASGSGLSGSTAWHGAFRFRQYLTSPKAESGEQPIGDLRELQFKKNQYGPPQAAMLLSYQKGLFLPAPGFSMDAAEHGADADDVFLELLRRFRAQDRNVGERLGPTYAPALFAKEEIAQEKWISKKDLEVSMRRLFTAGKIRVEVFGPPSKQRSKIAIANEG